MTSPDPVALVERLTDPAYRGALQHLRNWSQLDAIHDEAADVIQSLTARIAELEVENARLLNAFDGIVEGEGGE